MIWILGIIGSLILVSILIIFTASSKREKGVENNEKKPEPATQSNHGQYGHDATKSSPLKKMGAVVGAVVGILFAVLLTTWVITGVKGCWDEFTKKPTDTVQCKTNRLLRFEDFSEGKIIITLKPDVYFYPKGGRVKIVPPSGNWYTDSPGVRIIRPPEFGGEYMITPADSSAWGIEIWN